MGQQFRIVWQCDFADDDQRHGESGRWFPLEWRNIEVALCGGRVMADTGLLYAAAVADYPGVGTKTWSFPSNAIGDNTGSSAAEVDVTGPSTSHYLRLTFTHSIPAGSTINGIVAAFRRSATLNDSDPPNTVEVKLTKNGAVVGDNKSTGDEWPQSLAYSSNYGGSNDLWGTTWAATDTFGLAVSVAGQDPNDTAYIAAARMTIYYTEPSGAIGNLMLAF